MFINRLASINKDQSGFTLVELLMVIAISGIITLGLVMTIFQLFSGHARASGEMTVVRQVQNAGYYISRDTQMAREVSIGDDPATDELEVVTLTWYWYYYDPENPADRDGEGLRVIYTLEDGRLYRNYYFADVLEGEITEDDYVLKSRTFIAEYISSIDFSHSGEGYKLTVTASIGGWKPQSETRVYEVEPRPNVY